MTQEADAVPTEANQESSATNTPVEEQDWKALYERGLEANTKLTNDVKSMAGRLKADSNADVTNLMRETNDNVAALASRVNAFGARVASGETDELALDLQKIDVTTATTARERLWNQGYTQFEADMFDAFREHDDSGEPVPDGKIVVDTDSSALIDFTSRWKTATTAKDLLALSGLVTESHKIRAAYERTKSSTAVEEEKEAGEATAKKAGVNNLSIAGPATGGTKVKSRAQIEALTNINDFSDEDYDNWVAGKS